MSKVETKEDLKVGHYYRTTEDFFRVDSIINGEPHGSIYDIYQTEPVIVTNYPLSFYVEKFGCIEIFEEEYEETLQRIVVQNRSL